MNSLAKRISINKGNLAINECLKILHQKKKQRNRKTKNVYLNRLTFVFFEKKEIKNINQHSKIESTRN